MSLKKLVLLLIVVNAGYFSYAQGWLDLLTGSQSNQREPARLQKQINPDAISIANAPTQLTAPSPVTTAFDCPSSPSAAIAEQWMIYMGPYANKTELDRKKSELAKIDIKPEEVSKSSLKLGLSLAKFNSEAEARAGLLAFNKKGVRTATVILWSPGAAKPEKASPSC
jgi:hypothetical protein